MIFVGESGTQIEQNLFWKKGLFLQTELTCPAKGEEYFVLNYLTIYKN